MYYWYYVFHFTSDCANCSNAELCGIISSQMPMFPIVEAERHIRGLSPDYLTGIEIVFSTVLQISKEDFEHKLAELSKFRR